MKVIKNITYLYNEKINVFLLSKLNTFELIII